MPTKIKVLMVAAELSPLAKVGGLADVVSSLPPALLKLNIDARLIIPLYSQIDKKKYKLKKIYSDLEIPSGRMLIKINIWKALLPNTKVKIYFINAKSFFNNRIKKARLCGQIHFYNSFIGLNFPIQFYSIFRQYKFG